MLEKITFYIYTVISSDERYKGGKKTPIYLTIFLLSFFELFILIPILLGINSIFNIINIGSFISFPIYTRYFLIALLLIFIFLINYNIIGRKNNIYYLEEKFKDKKLLYLKYKWLLIVFTMVIGASILILLRIIKTNI